MKTNNSIAFFEKVKTITETKWAHIDSNDPIAIFIQPGTKWKPGLSEQALLEFEKEMGFTFPAPLRNFYQTMNGLDRSDIEADEDNNASPYLHFYSYPEHLNDIRSQIEWIYESTGVTPAIVKAKGISRIFPVWGHRFMMVDEPGHPVLSMYGNDIIFYGHTLADTFLVDHLGYPLWREHNEPVVPFWYPGWRKYPKMPKYKPNKGVMTKYIKELKRKITMQHRAMG